MSRAVIAALGAVTAASLTVACESSRMPSSPSTAASEQQLPVSDAGPSAPGKTGKGAEIYMADLKPLNSHVGYREVSGKARFQIVNGEFVAADNATGLQPGMIHPQHIHAAAVCPPPSADVNGDGFIDVIEGVPFYGPILVPLDTDLTNQAAGSFPFVHNHGGALQYRETTDVNALLADLNTPDPNPADAVVKLNGEPLNLSGRHVVLHGVALDTPLPATVATLPGLPAQLTLPVACGEIQRVN